MLKSLFDELKAVGRVETGNKSHLVFTVEARLCFKEASDATLELSPFILLEVVVEGCLLYTSPSPRDAHESRMPSSA